MKITPGRPSAPVSETPGAKAARPATSAQSPNVGWVSKGPAAGKTATAVPVAQADLSRTTVTLADLAGLQTAKGRRPSLGELATAYPNARIEGRGQPLAQLALQPLNKQGPDGSALTLAHGTIDKNGDIDVTRLFSKEISKFNQHLVIKNGDEHPIPLEFGLRNGEFCVGEPAHQKLLAGAGLPQGKDGVIRFDMRDMKQVGAVLQKLGVDPTDTMRVSSELMKQGVSVPLSADDKLRRVVCGLLDSNQNFVDIDDTLVASEHLGDHNAAIKPTVYASAKVSVENPGDVVLSYKRFNNQSYAAQGGKIAQALGKDTKSQHEGDMEATFVKVDTTTHELKSILAARHSYGELYSAAQVAQFQKETGLDAPTIGVSFKAHGGDLVGTQTRNTFAGNGEDGVREGDWKDHVLTEQFQGLDATKSGDATLLRRDQLNLVLEADDQQTLNMKVRLGNQRKGLFGTKVLDMFNDGVRMDRFQGTSWFYKQEKLNLEKTNAT